MQVAIMGLLHCDMSSGKLPVWTHSGQRSVVVAWFREQGLRVKEPVFCFEIPYSRTLGITFHLRTTLDISETRIQKKWEHLERETRFHYLATIQFALREETRRGQGDVNTMHSSSVFNSVFLASSDDSSSDLCHYCAEIITFGLRMLSGGLPGCVSVVRRKWT